MPRKRIQLLSPLQFGCQRQMLEALATAARDSAGWTLSVRPYGTLSQDLLDPEADGYIVPCCFGRIAAKEASLRGGLVVVYGGGHSWVPPDSVHAFLDEQSIGDLAAAHFVERGFKRFAYIHDPQASVSEPRGRAFERALADRQLKCDWIELARTKNPGESREEAHLGRQLHRLARPIGILAYNDISAARVLKALSKEGIPFPGDIAVLGVDNDELLCTSLDPSLSSIDGNWHEVGQRIADTILPGRREMRVFPES